MNIDQLKSDLTTQGYTHFNIKDFNEEYYNQLLELKCTETQNLKHLMTGVRVDGTSLESDEIQITSLEVQDKHLIFLHEYRTHSIAPTLLTLILELCHRTVFQDHAGWTLFRNPDFLLPHFFLFGILLVSTFL